MTAARKRPQLGLSGCQLVLASGHDRDVGAGGDELGGDRKADALAAAGDDDVLPREVASVAATRHPGADWRLRRYGLGLRKAGLCKTCFRRDASSRYKIPLRIGYPSVLPIPIYSVSSISPAAFLQVEAYIWFVMLTTFSDARSHFCLGP